MVTKKQVVGVVLACVLLVGGGGYYYYEGDILPGAGEGCTHYLSPTGNNGASGTSVSEAWATMDYACGQIDAGDTLCLINGTYSDQHCTFSNSGNATHPITLTAYNGTPTLDGVDNTGMGIRISWAAYGINQSYININGLKILNYFYGIIPENGSHHINISNCYMDTKQACIYACGSNVHDIHVDNCTMQAVETTALGSSYCANITYSDCTSLSSGHNGISLNHVYNSINVNGTASNTDHNGIQLAGSNDSVAKSCVAFNTGDNGYYMANGNYNTVVEDCEAYNTTTRGIVIDIAENVTIRRWHSWNISSADIHVMCAEPMRGISVTKNVYIIDSEINDTSPSSESIKVGYNAENVWVMNTKSTGTTTIYSTDADVTVGYYLDVLVQDENNNPVNGATVTVNHSNASVDWYGNGSEYKEIEIKAFNLHTISLFPSYTDGLLQPQNISQTITGSDGHTPLPANSDNTLVITDYRLDRHGSPWYEHPMQTTNFNNWTIKAEKSGFVNSTIVNADSTWYRTNPDSYQNTTIITLPFSSQQTKHLYYNSTSEIVVTIPETGDYIASRVITIKDTQINNCYMDVIT